MLLVTLPHGRREASGNHDEGALLMAPILSEALDDYDIEHEFLIGNETYRAVIDLNRGEARTTQYFEDFRELLMKADVHIDLHSFPSIDEYATDEEAITATGEDLREWSLSDVVLLKIEGITDDKLLEKFMNVADSGLEVDVRDVGHYNMLCVFAGLVMNRPTILVEVNEAARRDYYGIAAAFAEQVADFLDDFENASSSAQHRN